MLVENLELVFMDHLTNINTLALEALNFAMIIIIGKINWRNILKIDPHSPKLPDD